MALLRAETMWRLRARIPGHVSASAWLLLVKTMLLSARNSS